mmetsp:Transcript_11475/g.34830  ORF Transcript_11475/g.34830 Transcript_11475/m.34830 type:complete len:322 (-) Transcript_11475:1139-2104(-)
MGCFFSHTMTSFLRSRSHFSQRSDAACCRNSVCSSSARYLRRMMSRSQFLHMSMLRSLGDPPSAFSACTAQVPPRPELQHVKHTSLPDAASGSGAASAVSDSKPACCTSRTVRSPTLRIFAAALPPFAGAAAGLSASAAAAACCCLRPSLLTATICLFGSAPKATRCFPPPLGLVPGAPCACAAMALWLRVRASRPGFDAMSVDTESKRDCCSALSMVALRLSVGAPSGAKMARLTSSSSPKSCRNESSSSGAASASGMRGSAVGTTGAPPSVVVSGPPPVVCARSRSISGSAGSPVVYAVLIFPCSTSGRSHWLSPLTVL